MNKRVMNGNRKGRQVAKREAIYPPQLTTPIVCRMTYRFVASAAITARALTFTEVLDLLCMAATTTSAYRLVQSVKIKRIEIWAVAPAVDTPVTVAFQFTSSTSGAFGPSQLKSDTSMGFDRPAHLRVSAKEAEQVGQWQGVQASAIYGTITVPKGAVVDFTYVFSTADSSSATAVAGAVAGATVGQVYLRALDNAQATPQLIPPTLPTI